MALLAETLVEEWMNRQGFFTRRGVRHGDHEIDLLGVRPRGGAYEAWHVEVQVSFRPIGYICPLTDERARCWGTGRRSARRRPPEVVEECAKAWAAWKFNHTKAREARDKAWPGLSWKFHLVHGETRHEEDLELSSIKGQGIEVVPFHVVLGDLCRKAKQGTGSAGTDMADIVAYYALLCGGPHPDSARPGR